MSSFKKADGIIDSIQKQATGLRTLDGSAIEDFLSIAGYEDPQGGGGGSSDFSTASVTVVNNTEGTVMLYIPFYFDGEDSGTNAEFGVNGGETSVASAIMYKGTSFASLYTDDTVTASGDIEAHSEGENYYFMITGDGTITIS